MARLETRSESSLDPETLAALEVTRSNGALADVYLQYAASETALRAYLGMEAALREGALALREIEAIKIYVSHRFACEFCSTVHAAKGRRAGLVTETQGAIRDGNPTGDVRIDALLEVLGALLDKPGPLSDALLGSARQAGLVDAELVDLTLAAATILFTNMTNHINDTRLPD